MKYDNLIIIFEYRFVNIILKYYIYNIDFHQVMEIILQHCRHHQREQFMFIN